MLRRLQSMNRRARARQGRDGVAAIEFALVGLPFFFFLFMLFELGLVFLINSMVDGATMQTGRLIRTGQAVQSGMSMQGFEDEFCSQMSVFEADCAERTSVDVTVLPQFEGATPANPAAGATFDETVLDYDPGQPGNLMLVRVWYRQPVIVPFTAMGLPRLENETLITASTAFRNEPYTAPAAPTGNP